MTRLVTDDRNLIAAALAVADEIVAQVADLCQKKQALELIRRYWQETRACYDIDAVGKSGELVNVLNDVLELGRFYVPGTSGYLQVDLCQLESDSGFLTIKVFQEVVGVISLKSDTLSLAPVAAQLGVLRAAKRARRQALLNSYRVKS